MDPRTISEYARALRADLPKDVFAPRVGRLAWQPLHLAIIALATVAIAKGWGGTWAAVGLSVVIAHSFACVAFLSHEILHGSVVRGRRARHVLGAIGFWPFALSPRLWVVWHNQVHHGNTMNPEIDPDAYPTLEDHKNKGVVRFLDQVSIGRRRLLGLVSLTVGFAVQAVHALFQVGSQRRYMSKREQILAGAESLAAVAFWVGLGFVIGPKALVFAYVIPVVLANTLLTSYILTNHSLSPYTGETNDPLLNSLTVTVPRPLAAMHLNFGYHVEHHLFPSMSHHHGPAVAKLLEAKWPGRYQSMSLFRALVALHRTPRLHLDATTLVDAHTGERFPALAPTVGFERPVSQPAKQEEAAPDWVAQSA